MSELRKVLYAEDDEDLRLILRFSLEKVGKFEVCGCANGLLALESAPAFEPDLILLDVAMPKMDGLQTFLNLKKMPGLSKVPVVFLTAKAMSHEIDGLTELGATGIIIKPFDPVKLPKQLRLFWEYGHGN